MKTIRLYGALGENFGQVHRMDVKSPLEAFRALAMQLKGFGEMVYAGHFRVIRGNLHDGAGYSEETLAFPIGDNELHIVPTIAGAGGNGVGKIIIGAVIMIAAVVASPFTGGASFGAAMAANSAIFGISYGAFFMFGMAMVLSGVGTMLAPAQKTNYQTSEKPDQRASFFLGGQVNQVEQGGPIPIIYGRVRTGSHVISAGLSTEQI